MDLFKFFGGRPSSKEVAKDRLKLILIHDRANVSPELLEMMKTDILEVISKYVIIDSLHSKRSRFNYTSTFKFP